MPYAYECAEGDFIGTLQDQENEAWGEGVEHHNNSGHEHGEVKEFTG